ncbi:MAG: hypothetical protein QXK06_02560 [Candidatus Diapherotrites archaeon]
MPEKEEKKSALSELKIEFPKIEVPAEKKGETKTVTLTEKRQEKLREILDDMTEEMERLERIRERVRAEKISFFTPEQNKKILEEIEIPPLKLIRDKPKRS